MKLKIYLLLILFNLTLVSALDFSYRLDVTEKLSENQSYECILNIDGEKVKDYEIDKLNEYTKNLKGEITDNLNIKCTQNMNKMHLRIFNDNTLIYEVSEAETNYLAYNLRYNKMKLKSIDQDTSCDISYDAVSKSYDLDREPLIKDYFLKVVGVQCDNVTDFSFEVFNKSNSLLFYDEFEETSNFRYEYGESISKPYYSIIYFKDEFNDSNRCELTLDNDQTVTKTFDKNTKYKDRYIGYKVGNLVSLNCQHNIKELSLYIDDRKWDRNFYSKIYNGTHTINANINDILNADKEVEKTIVEKKIVEKVKQPIPKAPVIKPNPTKNISDTPVRVSPLYNITKADIQTIKIEEKKAWYSRLWSWIFD